MEAWGNEAPGSLEVASVESERVRISVVMCVDGTCSAMSMMFSIASHVERWADLSSIVSDERLIAY